MTILGKPIRIIEKLCEQDTENCAPTPPCPPVTCEREKKGEYDDKGDKWDAKGDNYGREEKGGEKYAKNDNGDKWDSKDDNYGREEKGEKYAKNDDDCTDDRPVCEPQCKEEEPCKQVCEEDNECDVTAALACLPACGDVDYASDHLDSGAPLDTANFDTLDTYDLAA